MILKTTTKSFFTVAVFLSLQTAQANWRKTCSFLGQTGKDMNIRCYDKNKSYNDNWVMNYPDIDKSAMASWQNIDGVLTGKGLGPDNHFYTSNSRFLPSYLGTGYISSDLSLMAARIAFHWIGANHPFLSSNVRYYQQVENMKSISRMEEDRQLLAGDITNLEHKIRELVLIGDHLKALDKRIEKMLEEDHTSLTKEAITGAFRNLLRSLTDSGDGVVGPVMNETKRFNLQVVFGWISKKDLDGYKLSKDRFSYLYGMGTSPMNYGNFAIYFSDIINYLGTKFIDFEDPKLSLMAVNQLVEDRATGRYAGHKSERNSIAGFKYIFEHGAPITDELFKVFGGTKKVIGYYQPWQANLIAKAADFLEAVRAAENMNPGKSREEIMQNPDLISKYEQIR